MKNLMAGGAAVLVLIGTAFLLSTGSQKARDVLALPEAWSELPALAEHPVLRWLNGDAGRGFVRRTPNGDWEAADPDWELSFYQKVRFSLRQDSKLPNNLPATPTSIEHYLRRMGERLRQNPSLHGFVAASPAGKQVSFGAHSAREDFPAALLGMLPDVLEKDYTQEVDILITPKNPGAGASLLSEWKKALAAFQKKGGGTAFEHLLRDPVEADFTENRWRFYTKNYPARVLRILSLPLLISGKSQAFRDQVATEVLPADRAQAYFTSEETRHSTGQRCKVAAFYNIRRKHIRPMGPRQRLITGEQNLSDLHVELLCSATDEVALPFARQLAEDWRKQEAKVMLVRLAGEEFQTRRKTGSFDVLVATLPGQVLDDPYPYFHSRGVRNASGHTTVEIDRTIRELDRSVSREGVAAAQSSLQEALTRDGCFQILGEPFLFISGGAAWEQRIKKALGPYRID